ncbi:hypothetical protein CDAR_609271 [Caerostris darwini]|uniref:Uncharacterized protein n=1 Tax=Caerostris darwini TaxID=1538125 RepID=A0AAV4S6V7_9ARAC|nr:hypothetical protein CDAR_609271 [Caerostris darwini]
MEKKNFCSVLLRSLEPDSFNSDILSTAYQAAPYLPYKLVSDVEEQIPQRRGANATRIKWTLFREFILAVFPLNCAAEYIISEISLLPSHHYSYTNCPDHKERKRSTQDEGYMGGEGPIRFPINEKEKKKELTKDLRDL